MLKSSATALMLDAAPAVIPSYVARVEPLSAAAWVDYLETRDAAAVSVSARLDLRESGDVADGPSVRLLRAAGDVMQALAALPFGQCGWRE